MQKYARPPITELIVELRYVQQIDNDVVDKICSRFAATFPAVERFADYNIMVDADRASADVTPSNHGQKLTNLAGTEVLIVRRAAFAYVALAPYPGWSEFRRQARDKWDTVKAITGVKQIARLGLRYINRLDVPPTTLANGMQGVKIQTYLRMYPEAPEDNLPAFSRFFMQGEIPLANSTSVALVNVSSGASLVPDRLSFALDIDVSRSVSLPQHDGKLWAMLDDMRAEKNLIFEACITDAARALFQT